LPWNERALTQDLELNTLLHAMAGDDEFLFDVAPYQAFPRLSVPTPLASLHVDRSAKGFRRLDASRIGGGSRVAYRPTAVVCVETQPNFTSRVRACGLCFPGRPSVSAATIGTPVPSIST
jgi:hypothetical protein